MTVDFHVGAPAFGQSGSIFILSGKPARQRYVGSTQARVGPVDETNVYFTVSFERAHI